MTHCIHRFPNEVNDVIGKFTLLALIQTEGQCAFLKIHTYLLTKNVNGRTPVNEMDAKRVRYPVNPNSKRYQMTWFCTTTSITLRRSSFVAAALTNHSYTKPKIPSTHAFCVTACKTKPTIRNSLDDKKGAKELFLS